MVGLVQVAGAGIGNAGAGIIVDVVIQLTAPRGLLGAGRGLPAGGDGAVVHDRRLDVGHVVVPLDVADVIGGHLARGRRRVHAGVRRLRFGQRAAAAGEIGRRHEVVPAVVDAGHAAANLGEKPGVPGQIAFGESRVGVVARQPLLDDVRFDRGHRGEGPAGSIAPLVAVGRLVADHIGCRQLSPRRRNGRQHEKHRQTADAIHDFTFFPRGFPQ